ncbi:hypothetical protein [Sulfurimonas sp.]|uniref:hypothetical protein n=1 Tax=Sulfurimonas sp. TaxID=2022749 RepID=UPI0025FC6BBD|nr:hypothetical protein [Sulfurimonas sp.]
MIETTKLIQKKIKTFKRLHILMILPDIVYACFIVYMYKYAPIPPVITDIQTLKIISYASIALMIILMMALKVARLRMLSSNSIFDRKETNKTNLDEPAFFANYLSVHFILWAIIEIIVICGIIIFLLSAQLLMPLILISVGLFFKLTNAPKAQDLTQLSEQYNSILVKG